MPSSRTSFHRMRPRSSRPDRSFGVRLQEHAGKKRFFYGFSLFGLMEAATFLGGSRREINPILPLLKLPSEAMFPLSEVSTKAPPPPH